MPPSPPAAPLCERSLGRAAPAFPAAALFGIAGLFGLAAAASAAHRAPLGQAAASFAVLGVWALWLARPAKSSGKPVPVVFAWHPGIWAQPLAQALIFVYWSLYAPEVVRQAPTMLLQVVFGLAVDALSNWRTRGRLQASASILPMVLSTNLFLWYDGAHMWLSLGLIALEVFSKALWRWKDSRYGHVFNPTGIALSLAGVLYFLISVKYWNFTRLEVLLLAAPNTSEVILIASLLVQLTFTTAPMTLAGLAAMIAWGFGLSALGIYYIPFPLQAQAFIGLSLLMTDPATSPRSLWGGAMFGALWGTLFIFAQISIAYGLGFEQVYFSKIFAVPLANLATPFLDRLAERWSAGRPLATLSPAARTWKYAAMAGIWVGFLALWTPDTKRESFEEPERAAFKIEHASKVQRTAADGRRVLCVDNPVFCRPFSFAGEIKLWSELSAASRPR